MSASSRKKSQFRPLAASLGFFLLAIPVSLAIACSLWLTATAAYENIKFARGEDQTLSFITIARDDAAKIDNFALQPNEDLVNDLMRLGQIQGRPVNPWQGSFRAVALSSAIMHIEIDLPASACKRLGAFFGKEAGDIAIQKIEAREGDGIWRQFYDGYDNGANPPSFPAINAACGKGTTTLALTLRLR